jgi:hypothetical protein
MAPAFSLTTLRALRNEVDALLGLLASESTTERAEHDAPIRKSPANPVRGAFRLNLWFTPIRNLARKAMTNTFQLDWIGRECPPRPNSLSAFRKRDTLLRPLNNPLLHEATEQGNEPVVLDMNSVSFPDLGLELARRGNPRLCASTQRRYN